MMILSPAPLYKCRIFGCNLVQLKGVKGFLPNKRLHLIPLRGADEALAVRRLPTRS